MLGLLGLLVLLELLEFIGLLGLIRLGCLKARMLECSRLKVKDEGSKFIWLLGLLVLLGLLELLVLLELLEFIGLLGLTLTPLGGWKARKLECLFVICFFN